MTSTRLDWDRPSNQLWQTVLERRASGRSILDMTISNPVEAGVSPSIEAIRGALEGSDLAAYRPDPRGDRAARQAVAATWASRGTSVDPEHLFLTASSSEAYGFLFKLLCDPGDSILVPAPSYPLFDYLAALEGVRTRPYPLVHEGQWHVDVEALRSAFTEGARAVVVVHPNNPTGSFLRRAEVDRIARECARVGAAIVSDEVFADFALRDDGDRAGSLAGEDRVTTFALGGLSKSVALPQIKLGWIAVGGPPEERDATCARLDLIADTYLSVGAAAQQAAPRLIELGPTIRAVILRRVRRNLDRIVERCRGTAVGALDVEAGWNVVLRVPATRTAEQWAIALAAEGGVLVQPGYFYDFAAEAYLVISLLVPPERFDPGVEIILETVAAG